MNCPWCRQPTKKKITNRLPVPFWVVHKCVNEWCDFDWIGRLPGDVVEIQWITHHDYGDKHGLIPHRVTLDGWIACGAREEFA